MNKQIIDVDINKIPVEWNESTNPCSIGPMKIYNDTIILGGRYGLYHFYDNEIHRVTPKTFRQCLIPFLQFPCTDLVRQMDSLFYTSFINKDGFYHVAVNEYNFKERKRNFLFSIPTLFFCVKDYKDIDNLYNSYRTYFKYLSSEYILFHFEQNFDYEKDTYKNKIFDVKNKRILSLDEISFKIEQAQYIENNKNKYLVLENYDGLNFREEREELFLECENQGQESPNKKQLVLVDLNKFLQGKSNYIENIHSCFIDKSISLADIGNNHSFDILYHLLDFKAKKRFLVKYNILTKKKDYIFIKTGYDKAIININETLYFIDEEADDNMLVLTNIINNKAIKIDESLGQFDQFMNEENVILLDTKSKASSTYVYNLKNKSTEKLQGILHYFKQEDKFVRILKS
ncbi:hypothetical protein OW763_13785 [Clostridium aestuarii]|uniref:Uncharacterized protein n=1 Tax=Clostridium aestuarii TaxID=338193 RepID=A0ABT4D2C6_9CLOT|nr:hypothetical protein [Clostridium aestuarii]MCY6485402.1 hypothetical protein [Clostridium aestuarii]